MNVDPNLYVSFLLVLVTGIYAYFTWRMSGEMRKAREPIIQFSYSTISPMAVVLRILNAGNGVAKDIVVKYWLIGYEGSERIWKMPAMLPGEYHEFFIPQTVNEYELYIEKLKEIDHIGYDISFKDAWNKKYRIIGKLGLGEILQTWAKSHMMYNEEPLEKMEHHLKNIDDNIGKIGRIIEKFRLDEIIGYRIDEYILEKIKKEKKISLEEMAMILNIYPELVKTKLKKYEKLGLFSFKKEGEKEYIEWIG